MNHTLLIIGAGQLGLLLLEERLNYQNILKKFTFIQIPKIIVANI